MEIFKINPNSPLRNMMKTFFAKTRVFLQTFFDHPGRALAVFIAGVTILWTVQCSLTQKILGMDIIETIVWGAQGQFGHFKHPPLSGWIGYAFSWISGHADWSMYLAAQLMLAIGVWYTYKLAKEFFPETAAAAAALLLYTIPYYNPSPMKFCSHFVEAAIQPVMAYYFYLAIRGDRKKDWILFGLASGLGFLGKYSAGMLIAAFFVYMLIDREARSRFRSIGPWIAGIVAFVVFSPHLVWLFQHDFSCLRHLEVRMENLKEPWYFPLVVTATAVYPFFLEAAYLFVAQMPWLRKNLPHKIEKKPLILSVVLTIVPAAFLVAIAAAGKEVILMWFSSMGSWMGIALVALFPWAITKTTFKRLYFLVLIFTGILFIGVTIDILVKPRLRCHADPREIVSMAENFYKTKTGTTDIQAVIGERWFAGTIENYSKNRPPACDISEPFSMELAREKIQKHGALLIGFNPADLQDFVNRRHLKIEFLHRTFEFQTPLGKKKSDEICFGYLPPGNFPEPVSVKAQ